MSKSMSIADDYRILVTPDLDSEMPPIRIHGDSPRKD